MRNITLSADARLIERARDEACRRKTTLNAMFREWLAGIVRCEERREQIARLFEDFDEYQAGGTFTRDEMNER